MEDLCITDDFHTIISLEHINQTTTQVFVPLIFWDFIFFKHYGISKPPMEFNNWFWKLVIQDGPILCKTGFIICDRFGMPKWEFFFFFGRALECWSHYKNFHFRCHWSRITWERMKDLCIVYFQRYFYENLPQSSPNNFQYWRDNIPIKKGF